MLTRLLLIISLLSVASLGSSQSLHQELQSRPTINDGVKINLSVGDTSLVRDLLKGDFFHSLQGTFLSRIDTVENDIDSTNDSLIYELRIGKMFKKYGKGKHSFIITEDPYDRLSPFKESLPFIDFNRVNGFVIGIGTPMFISIGRHEELGIKAGIAYGFEEKKGQSLVGAEYRIPLGKLKDTSFVDKWQWIPTLAIGAEYHNMTSTDDAWRAGRLENAVYAFFVREDFRDYYKIDGWNADLAFRPDRYSEFKLEYRSDIYYNQPQRVFIGRWGGNKVLPVNPQITTGRLNSWVITAGREIVTPINRSVTNLWGDDVSIESESGRAYLLQAEFGSNEGGDKSFARYILEARNFNPIIKALSIDTRLRWESSTGDVPIQKLSFLGGPSSLAGYKNKVFAGNRMLLLNTELRFSLEELSSFFDGGNLNLVLYNDLGYIRLADSSAGVFEGFGDLKPSSITYNIGIGIGASSGIQLGVMWRTDIKETGRFFFRFQRPF